jgi:chaperonin GroEL
MRGEPRIINTTNAREKAIAGAKKMYDAVAAAYGPTSGNVALGKNVGSIVISHDGVTIARDVILKDQEEDIGADLLFQASQKSNDISGDGTTGSILLGYHVMKKANERIAAGYNPMALRRGIDRAAIEIKKKLDKLAVSVEDESLSEVATISAGSSEIGKLVSDTIIKVSGVGITIEEYEGLGVIQDVIEGFYFEKGWAKPHFVNDLQTEEAVHERIHVLAFEKRIKNNQDIVPIIEMIGKETDYKAVLMIGNISDKALGTCILTNNAGGVKICVVNPPVYGDQMGPFLEDLTTVVGGKVVPDNLPADKVTKDYLGFAKKAIVARGTTTILEGGGLRSFREERIKTLEKQLKSDEFSSFQKEHMEKRLSKLQGKIGIIKVGGATEAERKEMKFRVEDAVHATRAAKEEGIAPGGGVTLAQLSSMDVPKDLDAEEAEGFKAVLEALKEPFKQLMLNAGQDPGHLLQKVLEAKKGYGFNVKEPSKDPVELIPAGVIDPIRVLKSIVENSCSVAGIAITLSASLIIDRETQLEQVAFNKASMNQ